MSQAENLADRIAFLNKGKIELLGTFSRDFWKTIPTRQKLRQAGERFGVSKITTEGISFVDIGKGLQVEAAFKKAGNVTLHIPPEDIVLSKRPLISSARNTFEVKIT